jgi:proton-dependent oligopeptide transporter, POT family
MTTAALVSAGEKPPFPRIFYIANGLELLERLAFYGVYINLSVYLVETVKLPDVAMGNLLGLFAIGRAWLPVPIGAAADRIGFRRSLLIAFGLYAAAYATLYAVPTAFGAYAAIFGMSLAGAFLKPVISGCVKRYSPPGRESQGFAIFYATVNAGSVVGKVLAKIVRTAVSLRTSMLNSVAACLLAFVLTAAYFWPPEEATDGAASSTTAETAGQPEASSAPKKATSAAALWGALTNGKLLVFLVVVSAYYLLIEQFYQTFPVYILRVFGPKAPREYITLINPLSIAVLQLGVARITNRLPPLLAMAIGIFVAGTSMAVMGAVPSLYGAGVSFFIFALAEMVYSPRYYAYISSFAPKGQEGLYMGIALIPFGVGGFAGGLLSGRLIAAYLPAEGARSPLSVWGTYAAIGVVCGLLMLVYRFFAGEPRADEASA